MKKLWVAAAAVALLGGCMTTPAEPDVEAATLADDPASLTSAPGYMQMAASSDMFEIESSRLALQMSQNQAVRSFAQMMINDHSRTTSELTAVGRQIGLMPAAGMAPHHAEMLDRLRAAGPGEFDAAYKREQIVAHQEALNLHRTYAERGDAPPLRAFAARVVPAIEMHYSHAQTLPEGMMMAPQPQPMPTAPLRRGERG